MSMLSVHSVPPVSGSATPKSVTELDHVAGPADDGDEIAGLEGARVVVARHLTDLAVVDLLREQLDRLVELVVGEVARVAALLGHQDAHRVAHLRQHRDAALERRVEQLVDRHMVSMPSRLLERALFQPSAPNPDCQGSEYWRLGVERDVLQVPAAGSSSSG